MIFVFGSNLAGIHGKGAAYCAREYHGAKLGIGEGRTGNAYALPTKNRYLQIRSLNNITVSVDLFLEYARDNPDLEFKFTRVGCGLAGYKDHNIGPLFKDAPANCHLPEEWGKYL